MYKKEAFTNKSVMENINTNRLHFIVFFRFRYPRYNTVQYVYCIVDLMNGYLDTIQYNMYIV